MRKTCCLVRIVCALVKAADLALTRSAGVTSITPGLSRKVVDGLKERLSCSSLRLLFISLQVTLAALLRPARHY